MVYIFHWSFIEYGLTNKKKLVKILCFQGGGQVNIGEFDTAGSARNKKIKVRYIFLFALFLYDF